MPAQTSYRAEVLSSWDAAAPRWQRMRERSVGTPFQAPHWLETWYGALGSQKNVEPVLVAVADRSDEDVLLIPFVRRSLGPLRTIEFADGWATDYNAPLIGERAPRNVHDAQALWRAVVEALPHADRIRLTKMPVEVRGQANPLALLSSCRNSETHGYIVDLPERFEDYESSLKKDLRSLLRRRWDRLVKDTKAELRWISDPDEGLRVFETLEQQQRARLQSQGARHIFDQAHYQEFYRRHVANGLASGGAVVTTIVASGEIVATFLGVTDGYCCTLIRSSQLWGEAWDRYGLGKLIISRSIRELHARGHRQFDLSIGDFAYKHDFGVRAVSMVELDVARSWRALPSVCGDFTWDWLRKNRYTGSVARSARKALSFRERRATPMP